MGLLALTTTRLPGARPASPRTHLVNHPSMQTQADDAVLCVAGLTAFGPAEDRSGRTASPFSLGLL